MKFIELTRSDSGTKVLLNIANIASIYPVKKYNAPETCIVQEVTGVDNYWEVTGTYEEIVAMVNWTGGGE